MDDMQEGLACMRDEAPGTHACGVQEGLACKREGAPGVPEKLGEQPLRLIIIGHNPSEHCA